MSTSDPPGPDVDPYFIDGEEENIPCLYQHLSIIIPHSRWMKQ
jgi:hypothetical protein